MVDNFGSLYNCSTVGRSWLDDGFLPNLFQVLDAWLSMSVVLFVVSLCSVSSARCLTINVCGPVCGFLVFCFKCSVSDYQCLWSCLWFPCVLFQVLGVWLSMSVVRFVVFLCSVSSARSLTINVCSPSCGFLVFCFKCSVSDYQCL